MRVFARFWDSCQQLKLITPSAELKDQIVKIFKCVN